MKKYVKWVGLKLREVILYLFPSEVALVKKIANWIGQRVRKAILFLIHRTKYFKNLSRRMYVCEVGFSGHVSMLDERLAEEEGLQPLNRFERWLLRSIIAAEKVRHQETFRIAVKECLGEDI